MKCSICITQFNRIDFLLKSLSIINNQTYSDIEIIISDNASSDDTQIQILKLKNSYKYPIIYHRFDSNQGYDRNLRKSLELASGDYCFVLGNDDTLFNNHVIEHFVSLLERYNFPDLGFCNYIEEAKNGEPLLRASQTKLLGTGPLVALKYYSCFSFVAGVFFKKKIFDQFNTDKFDKSIYAQVALASTMIASGAELFAINECMVLKDIGTGQNNAVKSNSYRDQLIRKWRDFKIVDGGLPSVIKVMFDVFSATNTLNNKILVSIYRKIYRTTLPFWILDFKLNKAFPNAVGLFFGLVPWKNASFQHLSWYSKIEVLLTYLFMSLSSLLLPAHWVLKHKHKLYAFIKR
jgi:glycosyltransferase involved in cell wall biosynthesis